MEHEAKSVDRERMPNYIEIDYKKEEKRKILFRKQESRPPLFFSLFLYLYFVAYFVPIVVAISCACRTCRRASESPVFLTTQMILDIGEFKIAAARLQRCQMSLVRIKLLTLWWSPSCITLKYFTNCNNNKNNNKNNKNNCIEIPKSRKYV